MGEGISIEFFFFIFCWESTCFPPPYVYARGVRPGYLCMIKSAIVPPIPPATKHYWLKSKTSASMQAS